MLFYKCMPVFVSSFVHENSPVWLRVKRTVTEEVLPRHPSKNPWKSWYNRFPVVVSTVFNRVPAKLGFLWASTHTVCLIGSSGASSVFLLWLYQPSPQNGGGGGGVDACWIILLTEPWKHSGAAWTRFTDVRRQRGADRGCCCLFMTPSEQKHRCSPISDPERHQWLWL